jgi:hypothetical protein
MELEHELVYLHRDSNILFTSPDSKITFLFLDEGLPSITCCNAVSKLILYSFPLFKYKVGELNPGPNFC